MKMRLHCHQGIFVVTDELVEVVGHDDEVFAVLAHEIGRVTHEHGLRSVLQSSVVAILSTAVQVMLGSQVDLWRQC